MRGVGLRPHPHFIHSLWITCRVSPEGVDDLSESRGSVRLSGLCGVENISQKILCQRLWWATKTGSLLLMEAKTTSLGIYINTDGSTAVSELCLWYTGEVFITWAGQRQMYLYTLEGGMREALRHLHDAEGSVGRAANAIKNTATDTWCSKQREPATA
jgi:hypothetical protein